MSRHTFGVLCAMGTATLWSILAIALKVSLDITDINTIVWFRFGLAFALVYLFYVVKKPRAVTRVFKKLKSRQGIFPILAGVCLATNYVGFMKGVNYTGPGTTQIIIQMAPITLAASGILFFKEKLYRPQIAGFIVALVGLIFFQRTQLGLFLGQEDKVNIGTLWIVIAAFTWVFYTLVQKVLSSKGWDPQDINLVVFGIATVSLTPLADLGSLQGLSAGQWVLLVFLGLNTIAAYGLLGEAIKAIPANQVSIIITLNPMITLFLIQVLGALNVSWLEKEPLNFHSFIGACLVVSGAILVVGRFGKKVK